MSLFCTCLNTVIYCRLILPNGLRFCTDKEIRTLSPKSHSFVLTKEDGEKCLGVSLIFYEEVKDINICHAVHTLQKMYTTEVEVVGGASSIRRARNEQRPRSANKGAGTFKFAYFLRVVRHILLLKWFHIQRVQKCTQVFHRKYAKSQCAK